MEELPVSPCRNLSVPLADCAAVMLEFSFHIPIVALIRERECNQRPFKRCSYYSRLSDHIGRDSLLDNALLMSA